VARTSDRDANQALRERFAQVYGDYSRIRAGMGELQERLAAMQVRVSSPDGLVTAVVGPRGQLISLALDPEAYREHTPPRLAAIITETVRQAAARAAEESRALLGEYLPAGSAGVEFLRTNDFGALMSRYDGDPSGGAPAGGERGGDDDDR
jgi:DNA-binding protein YbaB